MPSGAHHGCMTTNVMILGAGFGGLELASTLSERLPGEVEVTLVDQDDAFVFGYSKLEILFGRQTTEQVRIPYDGISMPGVEFRRERVMTIDPAKRHVVTDAAAYDPDVIVVALGADYDLAATPGFVEGGFEYYSVAGAERLRDELTAFRGGRVLLAVLSIPFKCPPAPYEAMLLLHDRLVARGLRDSSPSSTWSPRSRRPSPSRPRHRPHSSGPWPNAGSRTRSVIGSTGSTPTRGSPTSRITTSRTTCSSAFRCTRPRTCSSRPA